MRQLIKSLEDLREHAGESLRAVLDAALDATVIQGKTIEAHELYACATLLDPRFKGNYFFTKEVADSAENIIVEACEMERRKTDANRQGKNAATDQNLISPNNSLEQFMFMQSIIPQNVTASSSFSTYMAEPIAPYEQDVEEYWNRHWDRWPFLAKVASRYHLVPCSRASEKIAKLLERDCGGLDPEGSSAASSVDPNETLGMEFLKNNIN